MFGVGIYTLVRDDVYNSSPFQQVPKPIMYKKPRAPTVLCSQCDDEVRARLSHDDFKT